MTSHGPRSPDTQRLRRAGLLSPPLRNLTRPFAGRVDEDGAWIENPDDSSVYDVAPSRSECDERFLVKAPSRRISIEVTNRARWMSGFKRWPGVPLRDHVRSGLDAPQSGDIERILMRSEMFDHGQPDTTLDRACWGVEVSPSPGCSSKPAYASAGFSSNPGRP